MSLSLKVPVNIRATKYIYGTKTYSYDSTNRLTGVMKGVLDDEAYSYDGVGNRLTDIQRRNYTYNNGNELLTQNGTSFTFDANGNMTSKTDSSGTTSYVYDSENRLVQLTTPNAQLVIYKYDPFGRRIEKSVNGVITRYVYDREDILFELDGSGNVVTEYLHGSGIDEPIAMIKNNQTYYYHADGLGSIIAITDSAGNVVQRYEYDSFGAITYIQDSTFKQPYTYTAREYDQESGLYYYRARYYDARVGRFLSKDPFRGYLRKPQTQNRYSYVLNNPLKFIDPFGLDSLGFDGGTISWFNDQGQVVDTYQGISGPYGRGRLPEGNYTGQNLRIRRDNRGMICEDSGMPWSLDLEPNFQTDRTDLRIHPDAPPEGTAGCIGVACSDAQRLYLDLRNYLGVNNPTIPVNVRY
ncbi:MAG: RHS repeat protein [Nitrospirae bacterium]|nr:RHS repeat protein [Nitrospirota bacterium]